MGKDDAGADDHNSDDLVIAAVDADDPDATLLIRDLSAELAAAYDFADDGSGAFAPADVRVPRSVFLVARLGERPLGCGALRPLDDGDESASTAEIKRMYVTPAARGRGVARAILDRLEAAARELGYARVILETGNRQLAAIRLYERTGYERVPCYGRYVNDPRSICFGKAL